MPEVDSTAIARVVITNTLIRQTTGYPSLVDRAGTSGQPRGIAMSNNNLSSNAAPAVTVTIAQNVPQEELDREDRRWQLEWARRNIED